MTRIDSISVRGHAITLCEAINAKLAQGWELHGTPYLMQSGYTSEWTQFVRREETPAAPPMYTTIMHNEVGKD